MNSCIVKRDGFEAFGKAVADHALYWLLLNEKGFKLDEKGLGPEVCVGADGVLSKSRGAKHGNC
ncbi:MAG: hypothetical protein ACE5E0_05570 [Terriglobia bacterium]